MLFIISSRSKVKCPSSVAGVPITALASLDSLVFLFPLPSLASLSLFAIHARSFFMYGHTLKNR